MGRMQDERVKLSEKVDQAVSAIRRHCELEVEIGLILGSGLGELADEVEQGVAVPYESIPSFPASTVPGHAGRLVLGRLHGRRVAVMQGRVHYYEGYSIQDVAFPVRVMKGLGAGLLVVTNACGGVHQKFHPGDLMVVADHINMMGANPLRGPNDERLGPRFPPMARAYDAELRDLAHDVACHSGIKLHEGVYCALAGPSFETPAEVRYLERIGADAVGMSTVPEVIVARHSGMRVLGLSCVTNVLHQGPSNDTHEEVLQAAAAATPKLLTLLRGLLERLP